MRNTPTDFSAFQQQVEQTRFKDLNVGASGVSDAAEFERMREFLQKRYDGVQVTNSFADDGGQVWDYIPIEQQPALKASGQPLQKAPSLPGRAAESAGKGTKPAPKSVLVDAYGNEMRGPAGTIPLARITLPQLAKFESLMAFLRKGPRDRYRDGRFAEENHQYSIVEQNVGHTGMSAQMSLQDPGFKPGQGTFSLYQFWATAGSGAATQTVEFGVTCYPGLYPDAAPRTFCYSTTDNYETGGYNADGGFVQTDPDFLLGGKATLSDENWNIFVWLSNGIWWVGFGRLYDPDMSNIGYYQANRFVGGALEKSADYLGVGGETRSSDNQWPPMGTGRFAADDPKTGYDASFSEVQYLPIVPPGSEPSPVDAELTTYNSLPKLYNGIQSDYEPGYFFFGGPGGTNS
ncbi:MAG: neprosin family prolyl endopeptidase [Verrucomicrobia bacterium]|nr:neprosin family prolyl endopeptidase [Verrucomicrobiota bacterium]